VFLCDIMNNFERYTTCELIHLKLELNDLRNLNHLLMSMLLMLENKILGIFCVYSTRLI